MNNSTSVLEDRQGIFKKVLIGASVAVMCLGFGLNASADDSSKIIGNDVNVSIDSGGLSLSTPSIETFENITLDGEKKFYKTKFNDVFTVKDLRGTHEGWKLSVSASQFDNGAHELPEGSLTLGTLASIDGQLDEKISAATAIDEGSVDVVNAAQGSGMGSFDLAYGEEPLTLAIDPATAKKGTYTSTLTWTLASTPN